MCSYTIGRYICIRLPFRAAPAGNMFQKKIYKLFSDMPNVFSTADDMLNAGFHEQGKDILTY